jgi:hypothetical protein
MDEKERYYAQIEAQLDKCGQSFGEIKNRIEQSKEHTPEIDLDAVMEKHAKAKAKLEALRQADEPAWESHKTDLDRLLADVDESLRKALAYEVA